MTIELNGSSSAAVEHAEGFALVGGENGDRFTDVGELLRHPRWKELAEAALDEGDEAEGRRLRPVLNPGAVICVGLNYRTHIKEMGRDLPEHPTLFSKLPRALADPDQPLRLPMKSSRVDYEGELVAVIGAGGSEIDRDQAWETVAGVTLMNDVTLRDFQRRTVQWFAGKTWEESTPTGPAVVTVDELADLGERELKVEVNGEVRQRASISDLVFDIPALVADASQIVTLLPGDLIATGTPGGVASGMDPPRWLADGDVVEVEVSGIGRLTNTFHER